ncbi:MAG: mycothiol synthase [Streptosporangiaceae bacterium]
MSAVLSPPEITDVLALADAAAEQDGVAPLSEQTLLAVRHGGGRHLLRYEEASLAGYAHLDGDAELVVHPRFRRRGHGRALVDKLGDTRIWAHGDSPSAAALAAALGWTRVRTLLQMRRPLAEPLPVVRIHAGYRIRTFQPSDAQAWLNLNKTAFSHHPEQGHWTMEDLRNRMGEPWFDPAGFFLATQGEDRIVGFHWTKIHPEGIGEVYVVGVDPTVQGVGLGRTLTLAGLHYLRDRGLPTVLLYVDEENPAAVRLYESLGFTRHTVDVMYAPGV